VLTWILDIEKNGGEEEKKEKKERRRREGEAAARRRSSRREGERRRRRSVRWGWSGGSAGRQSGEAERKQGPAAMVQPKQGLSLLKFIPKAMRPSTSDVSSVALWGTTAAVGALWLVQPFDWIKAQISGAPAEEEQK
jgi:hypothetical protein